MFFRKASHEKFSRAANVATKAAFVMLAYAVNILMSEKIFSD